MGYVWIITKEDGGERRTVIMGSADKVAQHCAWLVYAGWDFTVDRVPMSDEDGMRLNEDLDVWCPPVERAQKN